MSCREYAAKKLAYQRQQADELKRVAKIVGNEMNRRANTNPEIEIYQLTKRYFYAEKNKKLEAFEKGEITAEEFMKWLREMQAKPTIKEAKDYDFEQKAPIKSEDN